MWRAGLCFCAAPRAFLDPNDSRVEERMPRPFPLRKTAKWSVVDGISKKIETSVMDQPHSFPHAALSGDIIEHFYLLNRLGGPLRDISLKIYRRHAISITRWVSGSEVSLFRFLSSIPSASDSLTSRENIVLSTPFAIIEFAYLFMNLEPRNN